MSNEGQIMAHADLAAGLLADKDRFAERMVQAVYGRCPGMAERYGKVGRDKCLADHRYHLQYFGNSLRRGSPALFIDYAVWLKSVLAGYGIPARDLIDSLATLEDLVAELAPDLSESISETYLRPATFRLSESGAPESFLSGSDTGALAGRYIDLLIKGQRDLAFQLVEDSVGAGMDLRDVYLRILQPSLWEIGRLWQMNKLSIAEEHYVTAATQLLMSRLQARMFEPKTSPRHRKRVVAACCSGEQHELGLRMITDFFELENWDTHYLGANTPIEGLLNYFADPRPTVFCLSATIGYHLEEVASTISAIRSGNGLDHVRVMVGGRPFNIDPGLHERVGADLCARDARDAVKRADALLSSAA